MDGSEATLALGAFVVASVASFAATPLSARIARRFGVFDLPAEEQHKKHAVPTPYLGGLAIFCGLLASGLAAMVSPSVRDLSLTRGIPLALLLAFALGAVGLVDDVRHLPRSVRLGAELLVAFVAYERGFQVQAAQWEWVNLVLTMVWIVGITNAINLLDNMDGLSAGIVAIAGISFAVMAAIGHLPGVSVLSAAVAGAAIGFLAHNRHPARIFMGDAGSLFLGFMLAVIGLALRFDNLVEVTFLVPVVTLGVPIFDTTLVVLSRAANGKPIFEGARDHVSHRLVTIGIPLKAAVAVLYFSALCLGWLGLVISRADAEVAWMLLAFVFAMGVFLGYLLWRVPVYEGSAPMDPAPRDDESLG